MNDRTIKVSAIVISWNGRAFLADCLRTLAADLAELPHEIIVVDNGSTDGSVGIITETSPQARLVVHHANLGFAKAVNAGIEAAHGEYLFILNQDIRVRAGCTSTLIGRLESDRSIALIGPKFVGFDGRLQHSARSFPTYRHIFYHTFFLDQLFPQSREFGSWKMTWFDHQTEMDVDQPMGAAMLIPRSVIDKVGLFDESFPIYMNDVDCCRRVALSGGRRVYCPAATIEHFVGGSTRTQPVRMIIESHRSMYRYLRKYARPHELPLLWLSGLALMIGLIPRILGLIFRSDPTTE
ncbi:MAG: glycosyltransferase family 2 protein [candidate division Zixibacteria bacterium]|nr:glycosyltransferase family 2 protein [candidate division Zixibacteria bacterium]